jgi:hypothetical protein
MGMTRDVSAVTGPMKDTVAHGQREDTRSGGGRTLPAAGHEYREGEIDAMVEFEQARDSSRSRGYGRYEI